MPSAAPPLLAYAALVASALSFSTNWVVGRALHEAVHPAALALFRWTVAIMLLAPFAARFALRDASRIAANWRRIALFAVLGLGTYNLCAYWGMRYTSATNGSILNALVPVFIVILSAMFLGERLRPRALAGVAISLAGVIAIVTGGSLAALAALDLNRGDVIILAGILVWAIYSIALRWRPAGLHPLSFLIAMMIMAIIYTGALATIEYLVLGPSEVSPQVLAGVGILGVFPSIVAYICWNYGVTRIGASRAGVFSNLIPVFGTALSIVFLDERIAAYHLIGMLAVFFGVYLAAKDPDA